jgi:TonB family protein
MATFAAILALPVLSIALPALDLPASWLPGVSGPVFSANAKAAAGDPAMEAAPPGESAVNSAATPRIDWPLCLMLIWCAGSLALLAQMAEAYLRIARQRRVSPAFDPAFDLPRGVAVLEAREGSMPLAFGVLHPVIFLPKDASYWSAERRAMVLRHELAHIERGDAATHLAARSALSLLWWNPLAWMAWREFLREREKAADDLVLAGGARASDYAGHLLEIARSMQSQSVTAWAAVAMARRSQLEGRLLSILDARVSRKSARRASAIGAAIAAVAICAPFAAVRAQNSLSLPPDVEATIRAAAAQKNHEIIDNAAAAFEKVQNYDTARKLLDSGLEIRASESGGQSGAYAAGLVKLGDLESKRNNGAEALRFYQKSVSLGDMPETAPALVALGVNAIEGKDMQGAMSFLERARAVSTSPDTTGKAYMWMAMVEEGNPDHAAQAEEDFRKSVAAMEPNTSDSATALFLFARFLSKQGRDAEAEPLEKQVNAAIRSLEKVNRAENDVLSKFARRAGGDVSKPELISKVEPSYTEEARAAKLQGTVVLSVVIEPDGAADDIQVVKSLGLGLDQKAVEAVQQWRFKPGMYNGAATPVRATIEVNFRLL